jgi:hypothetical protein
MNLPTIHASSRDFSRTATFGVTPDLNSTFMVIGFGGTQYTLWQINTVGEVVASRLYIQNLSTELNVAVHKAIEHSDRDGLPLVAITNLKGLSWYNSAVRGHVDPTFMQFGKYGTYDRDLLRVEDVIITQQNGSYLQWYFKTLSDMYKESPITWEAHYTHVKSVCVRFGLIFDYNGTQVYLNDLGRIVADVVAETYIWGYHAPEKAKITFDAQVVKMVWFNTDYGQVCAVTFICIETRRAYMYVGAATKNLSRGTYARVTGTVAYKEYKGISQTLVKRPKFELLNF